MDQGCTGEESSPTAEKAGVRLESMALEKGKEGCPAAQALGRGAVLRLGEPRAQAYPRLRAAEREPRGLRILAFAVLMIVHASPKLKSASQPLDPFSLDLAWFSKARPGALNARQALGRSTRTARSTNATRGGSEMASADSSHTRGPISAWNTSPDSSVWTSPQVWSRTAPRTT